MNPIVFSRSLQATFNLPRLSPSLPIRVTRPPPSVASIHQQMAPLPTDFQSSASATSQWLHHSTTITRWHHLFSKLQPTAGPRSPSTDYLAKFSHLSVIFLFFSKKKKIIILPSLSLSPLFQCVVTEFRLSTIIKSRQILIQKPKKKFQLFQVTPHYSGREKFFYFYQKNIPLMSTTYSSESR